jgi:hypothetical protein
MLVVRVLHIAVLLLLLATGVSAGAEDSVCHASMSVTSSASASEADLPSAMFASATAEDVRAGAQSVSPGHCLSEFVVTTAELVFPALGLRSFDVAPASHGHGLPVPPEPQPPRS